MIQHLNWKASEMTSSIHSLLTLKEISSKACPETSLRRWAKEGILVGAFKLGRKWVIKEEDWNKFVDSQCNTEEGFILPSDIKGVEDPFNKGALDE